MRQPEIFKGPNFERNDSKNAADGLFLPKDVYAKSRESLEANSVVELHVLSELIRLLRRYVSVSKLRRFVSG